MKVGDLVKVKECEPQLDTMAGAYLDFPCECFFCAGRSNRVGFVLGPGPHNSWMVAFDCGEWRVFPVDIEHGDVSVLT